VSGFTAPQAWPNQLTQKWKGTVGIGDSTPVLVGEKLYAFGRQDTNEVITCLDVGSGKTLWEERYPAQHVVTGPPARHPGTRSSPAVAQGKLCALGVGGILSCLDAESGKVIWRKQSTNDFLGTAYDFDSSMSPLIAEGRCFVHVGGKGKGAVLAFDLASGEPKWKWDGDAPSSSSPVVLILQGRKQLVTITAKSVLGLDLSDGKLLWQLPFEATQGNNTTPIIDGQIVIYTGQGKGMFAVRIEPQADGFAAIPVWTNAQLGARFTTPVLKDGLLFGYHNHLFCADAQSGATLWADATNRGNSAALIDAGEVMLALGVNSELMAFKPSGKEYVELARIKVADSETWAHPVVCGKRLFVRDREKRGALGIRLNYSSWQAAQGRRRPPEHDLKLQSQGVILVELPVLAVTAVSVVSLAVTV
jgi:outer membrane protein assembly factor BamB